MRFYQHVLVLGEKTDESYYSLVKLQLETESCQKV